MVRGYVGDYGYVRLEVIHIVKLETAQFQDIYVVLLCSDLICIAFSDVASQAHVQPGLHQQVVYQ